MGFDILPALKDGNSSCETAMPCRENVLCCNNNSRLNEALKFFGRGLKNEPKTREIVIERLKRLIDDGWDWSLPQGDHAKESTP